MLLNRRHLLAGLAGAAVLPAWPALAQSPAGVSDIGLLRDAIGAIHPGLHRYLTPPQLAAAISLLERSFERAEATTQRYLALARFTAAIRCGHTYPNFFNQSDGVAASLFGGRTRLPFRFRWLGSRMIVTDGLASGLPRGAEVLEVDGRAARDILSALLPLVRADGANDGKRRSLLSVEGRQRIETFDVFHGLMFPPDGEQAALRLRLPDGRTRQVRLDRIDLAARQRVMGNGGSRTGIPGWTLDHRGRTAIMTMGDWALYNSSWDWRGWIDAAFEELARRGTEALILDLRANEGGNDVGNRLLARMVEAPIPLRFWEQRVRYRRVPERLRPHLDTWNRDFDRIGEEAEDLGNGFYRLRDEPDRAIAPVAPRFAGRLMVLTGPENSSATFNFAALVRRHRLGVLVGETTGGNRRGLNGNGYYFLRLPESGLEVDIPLVGMFPPEPQPDAGIVPDVAVVTAAGDIAAGRDPAMARALALARS